MADCQQGEQCVQPCVRTHIARCSTLTNTSSPAAARGGPGAGTFPLNLLDLFSRKKKKKEKNLIEEVNGLERQKRELLRRTVNITGASSAGRYRLPVTLCVAIVTDWRGVTRPEFCVCVVFLTVTFHLGIFAAIFRYFHLFAPVCSSSRGWDWQTANLAAAAPVVRHSPPARHSERAADP